MPLLEQFMKLSQIVVFSLINFLTLIDKKKTLVIKLIYSKNYIQFPKFEYIK